MQYDDTGNNRGDSLAPRGGKAEAEPIAKVFR
jgi:hypothetical protein